MYSCTVKRDGILAWPVVGISTRDTRASVHRDHALIASGEAIASIILERRLPVSVYITINMLWSAGPAPHVCRVRKSAGLLPLADRNQNRRERAIAKGLRFSTVYSTCPGSAEPGEKTGLRLSPYSAVTS